MLPSENLPPLFLYSKTLILILFTGLPTHLAQQVPPTTASTEVGGCPIKLRPISISSNSNSANQWTNLTSTFSSPHTLANHCRMNRPADFRRKSTLKFHPIPILQEGTVTQNQYSNSEIQLFQSIFKISFNNKFGI